MSRAGRLGGAAKAVARVPARAGVGYFRGLTYPFRGMKLVFFERPDLVRFWIFPIALTVIALAGVLWAAFDLHGAVTNFMWAAPKSAGAWGSIGRFFHEVLSIVIGLLMFVAGVLLVVTFTNVIAAPFNDALSEEVERIRTGREGPPFNLKRLLRETARTVGLESLKLVVYVLVMGPLFVLSLLLPGVGQVIYSIFAFLFTAIYFAMDYVDWPAARNGRRVGQRLGLVGRNFLPMFGFGTGVWLFLFVPLLNLLFMPAAVAGGTLLYLDLEPSVGGSVNGAAGGTSQSA